MKRKVRIQEPDALPKAIPYEDIERIFNAVTNIRNRALLMLLLSNRHEDRRTAGSKA